MRTCVAAETPLPLGRPTCSHPAREGEMGPSGDSTEMKCPLEDPNKNPAPAPAPPPLSAGKPKREHTPTPPHPPAAHYSVIPKPGADLRRGSNALWRSRRPRGPAFRVPAPRPAPARLGPAPTLRASSLDLALPRAAPEPPLPSGPRFCRATKKEIIAKFGDDEEAEANSNLPRITQLRSA
ncbi:uncharacterized protein ACOB8E_015768 [Sarcophilus harrisii]